MYRLTKSVLFSLVISLMIISGTACSPPFYPIATDAKHGNTAGNINNGGYAAIQGDWVYYTRYQDHDAYRIRTDGTMKTKLADGVLVNVNKDKWRN